MNTIVITPMDRSSWTEAARIYNEGIATKNATFEIQAPTWEVWDSGHRKDCRLIATLNGNVVGWAALSNVSGRKVYAGVA